MQDSIAAAVAALRSELQDLRQHPAGHAASAVLRIEAQVPATASALQWLMVQPQNRPDASPQHAQAQPDGWQRHDAPPHSADLAPAAVCVYFSPRRSPYPAADALGSSSGAAIAGLGSAWTWHGVPGQHLGRTAVASMQRFLIDSNSAVKVLGGARFDPGGAIADEWRAFGSYYMVLPALEMVRARSLCVCGLVRLGPRVLSS